LSFDSLGYIPTENLIGGNGASFRPGLFGRMYFAGDLPISWLSSYLYAGQQITGQNGATPRLIDTDVGWAVRPLTRFQNLEFRVGYDLIADVEKHTARNVIGCETCGLVSVPRLDDSRCPRCASVLHQRKPDSIARTWALVIAAAVLYLPANYYPVLTVVQLGAGQPSTILGGVEELLTARQYPLAALVFFASILVPVLKLVGLSIMLIATQTGRVGWLRDRTRLYHIVRFIGRWSMIDILALWSSSAR
jgi:uncharacterized paraquat-inducible protein A